MLVFAQSMADIDKYPGSLAWRNKLFLLFILSQVGGFCCALSRMYRKQQRNPENSPQCSSSSSKIPWQSPFCFNFSEFSCDFCCLMSEVFSLEQGGLERNRTGSPRPELEVQGLVFYVMLYQDFIFSSGKINCLISESVSVHRFQTRS